MNETTGLTRPRCTATNRQGERCGRAPIPGGTVCVLHGGAVGHVRQAAQRRLLAGADMAIDYLLSILEPRGPCPACGRSDVDRDPVVVRACQLVLDRAGFGPSAEITLTAPTEVSPFRKLTKEELMQEAETITARVREATERMHIDEQQVIDAEPLGPEEEEV